MPIWGIHSLILIISWSRYWPLYLPCFITVVLIALAGFGKEPSECSVGIPVTVIVVSFLVGWGLTIPGDWGSQADTLKQAMLPTVSQSECEEDNKDAGIPVTSAMFCTGHGGSSPISTCNTDSGGPIVCKDLRGRWSLQGVVSWGEGGCHPGHYSVNARVSKFTNWIQSYISS